jgi:DNA polymerase III alpha subunit
MLAFRQLFLKRFFSKEFFCSLLRSETASTGDKAKAKLMKYIVEAKHFNAPVESPHVNNSAIQLETIGDKIYIGFEQVKGIGLTAAKPILKKAPYVSFQDFLVKHEDDSKVNKKAIEALIYTDAFRFDADRNEILYQWHRHNMINAGNRRKGADGSYMEWELFEPPTTTEMFMKEFEHMSIVLSVPDPMKAPPTYRSLTEAIETKKGKIVKVKMIISSIDKLKSKAGNTYFKLTANDLLNKCTLLAWKNYARTMEELEVGDIVLMSIKHMDGDTFSLVKFINKEEDID